MDVMLHMRSAHFTDDVIGLVFFFSSFVFLQRLGGQRTVEKGEGAF
jgi:hypothetical protein